MNITIIVGMIIYFLCAKIISNIKLTSIFLAYQGKA